MSKTKERKKAARLRRKTREAATAPTANTKAAGKTIKVSAADLGVGGIVRVMWPTDDPTRGAAFVAHYAMVLRVWEAEGYVRLVYGTSQRVPSSDSGLFWTEFAVRGTAAKALGLDKPTRWDARTILDLPIGNVKEVCGILPASLEGRVSRALRSAGYDLENPPQLKPWQLRR